MKTKGFQARVVVRHLNNEVGSTVYLKPCEWKWGHFGDITRYAILNQKTGRPEGYADANEFKNRFETVNRDSDLF